MTKRKFTRVTNKDFELIKTLLSTGLSQAKIHEVLGRSSSTIHYVSKSDNFADYQKLIERNILKNTEKANQEKEVKAEVSDEPRIEYKVLNRLDTIIKLLETMKHNKSLVSW